MIFVKNRHDISHNCWFRYVIGLYYGNQINKPFSTSVKLLLMLTKQNIESLKMAYRDILNAESELNRPHEDVVTLSACQSVRNAMKQMMSVYLNVHEVAVSNDPSLNDLAELCIQSSPAFSAIDLSNIECKGIGHSKCDGKYCLSIENVSCCLSAANKLKDLVWWELKVK